MEKKTRERAFIVNNGEIEDSTEKQYINFKHFTIDKNKKVKRISSFCKRSGNFLYIKVYTLHPNDKFDKKEIRKIHAENGYLSPLGRLVIVSYDKDRKYSDFFRDFLNQNYFDYATAEALRSGVLSQ